MKMEPILLLKDWDCDGSEFIKGTSLEVDADTAADLIHKGIARGIDTDGGDDNGADDGGGTATATKRKKSTKKTTEKSGDDNDNGDGSDPKGSAIVAEVKALLAEQVKLFSRIPVGPRPVVVVGKHLPEADESRGFKCFPHFLQDVAFSVMQGKRPSQSLVKYTSLLEKQQQSFESGGIVDKFTAGQMVEGDDAAGGFTVPPMFRTQVMEVAHQAGLVRARATRVPMQTNVLKIPAIDEISRVKGSRAGGVEMRWEGETETAFESRPKFRQITLAVEKLFGTTRVSDELLTDSPISMETLVTRLFGNEIAFELDDVIINGNGTGQPLGILNAAALVTVTRATASAVESQDILDMWERLHPSGRRNAVWFINLDVEQSLTKMHVVGTNSDRFVYIPPGGFSGSQFGTLFGRDVIPIEQAQTLGTKGDVILADMTAYLFAEKANGIKAATSIHVNFLTEETAFRFSVRVDGQPWWRTSLTPANGTNTLSPFVTIAT